MPHTELLDRHFPRYTDHDPAVPVWCVTPKIGRCLHRFFDTSPIDPSGRLLAVTRLPFEDRVPGPGDAAEIVVVDLETGSESVVARTRGWETQLAANVNWIGERALVFNDVEPGEWEPFARRATLAHADRAGWTATLARLDAPVYHASHDGSTLASACMKRMRWCQAGYGVIVPEDRIPENIGVRDDDGLMLTDARSGRVARRVSLARFIDAAGPDELRSHDARRFHVHGFHAKWSPDDRRLIFTIRWFPADGRSVRGLPTMQKPMRFAVYTLRPDGSEIRLAVPPDKWELGGHHINFFPAGDRLSMNLGHFAGGALRFCACRLDGSGLEPLLEHPPGSGHPSVHPTAPRILTDAYRHEPVAFDDGSVPLRWVDLRTGDEQQLARVSVDQPALSEALRVDPHPAWDRTWRWVTFNGFVAGTRRVFLADLASVL